MLRRTVKLMHDAATVGVILLAMTVKLELTPALELEVASSYAKSQGVTIKNSKERKGGEVVNFSQHIYASEEGAPDERAKDKSDMVQYVHGKYCKVLRRTVKLMHDVATVGVILLAMTVKLELPLTRQLL